MEFTGKLGRYKVIETNDNTFTVWSEFFDENCHNLSGAFEETIYNYITGCHISDQLKSDQTSIDVFDVGFGVGIGLKCLIEFYQAYLLKNKVTKKLSYYSIELDEDLFLWSMAQNFKQVPLTKIDNCYKASIPLSNDLNLEINVFIGDGTVTIPKAHKEHLLPKFTAIFQDAFSPTKNPALWSVGWFKLVKDISASDVYLSTYSSSIRIRKSMVLADWKVSNHVGFGTKKNMTKARLIGEMDSELLKKINESPLEAIL